MIAGRWSQGVKRLKFVGKFRQIRDIVNKTTRSVLDVYLDNDYCYNDAIFSKRVMEKDSKMHQNGCLLTKRERERLLRS